MNSSYAIGAWKEKEVMPANYVGITSKTWIYWFKSKD